MEIFNIIGLIANVFSIIFTVFGIIGLFNKTKNLEKLISQAQDKEDWIRSKKAFVTRLTEDLNYLRREGDYNERLKQKHHSFTDKLLTFKNIIGKDTISKIEELNKKSQLNDIEIEIEDLIRLIQSIINDFSTMEEVLERGWKWKQVKITIKL